MSKEKTSRFVSEVIRRYGDRYDYSKTNYKNSKTKVIITCREHGDFMQSPSNHLAGNGCPACACIRRGNAKRSDAESFILKAKTIHSNTYEYSKVKYKDCESKVVIVCRRHGEFEQRPSDHLHGQGCPSCGLIKRAKSYSLGNDLFIEKSKSIHGDRYDYSLVKYEANNKEVMILCEIHGVFLQKPSVHLIGCGCPYCGKSKQVKSQTDSEADFARKSRAVHGDKYIYDKCGYKNSLTNVSITCPIHGVFVQRASHHIQGSGCPSCAVTGFDKNKKSYVYFLMSEKGIKVGITNKIKQRIMQLRSSTPFEFEVIKYVKLSGVDAISMESDYHNRYESAGLGGFNGCTEWLKYSPELMNEIMNN